MKTQNTNIEYEQFFKTSEREIEKREREYVWGGTISRIGAMKAMSAALVDLRFMLIIWGFLLIEH